MAPMSNHWTERSIEDFVHRIASDFVLQLEKKMDAERMNQKELAAKLGVSVGRVSQIMNNPGNLTLKNIVQYARILRMKVSIVAYEDGDPENKNGPINSEIFYRCWQRVGKPADFFAFASNDSIRQEIPSPKVWTYVGFWTDEARPSPKYNDVTFYSLSFVGGEEKQESGTSPDSVVIPSAKPQEVRI